MTIPTRPGIPHDATVGARAPGAAEAVLRMGEILQALGGTPGAKALLRRFGEVLCGSFGVTCIGFARAGGAGPQWSLKPRAVTIEGVSGLTAGDWNLLAQALTDARLEPDQLREGFTCFSMGDRTLALAMVQDPHAENGSLVAWEPPASGASLTGLDLVLVDQLVRHLQSESRWFRRLDKNQELIYRDDLTGLFNTRYFEIALETELRRADRFQNQFCLLFIDLDGFKPINDQHGHLSGSGVLKQVAEVIREAVREVDVPVRYGGDEFVVLLLGATCAKGVLVAERVRRRIEQKEFRLEFGGTARVTCSIGVAAYPEHGKDRETLLKMADDTMYDSKRAGKNRVTVVSAAAT